MDPITFASTPQMIASQGYAGLQDLKAALGLSRAGFYELLKKMNPAPKSIKMGVKVYFEVQPFLDYIKAGGQVPQDPDGRNKG